MAAGAPSSRMNRRRTDLVPTLPSPRDGPSSRRSFARSPGRTYSMSRLDQLAQPRVVKRALAEQRQPLAASSPSMSRSMSHLATAKGLKRTDNARSMGTLPGAAAPVPRPTRAERLRRRAREIQQGKASVPAPAFFSQLPIVSGPLHFSFCCTQRALGATTRLFRGYTLG